MAINNIFGLDIAEFPLYLAEMNILMKLLPYVINHDHEKPIVDKIQVFWTKDSIAEFIDSGIFASGQISLNGYTVKPELSSYVRDENDLKEMKNSMGIIPRRRFDFVVGNPPYISYNECSEQNIEIFQLMKKKKVNLNNIYGVNLHSVPNNPKRYRPNPNLYAFFIALGFALLKEGAKICYIVPQTLLFAGDLDVLRYYLSKKTTIEKIILFNGHVFVGRGLNQKDKVPTSSLIFVARRAKPAQDHQIEIIHYLRKDDDVEKIMKNIAEKKYTDKKTILQTELLSDIASWNYLFKKDADIKFIKLYKNLGEEISVYYEHSKALARFNSNFYFDSGYSIDEKQVLPELPENTKYFRFPKINEDYWSIHNFLGFWPDIRKGKGKLIIRLRQANQRYNLLDSKYKIVWSYQNPERFHYTGLPVIWARNRYCSIGSANKKEVFYLLALLNSGITKKVLDLNLRTEAEKSFLVSTTAIKEYIRIPIITEKNMRIKEKIIQLCEELLNLEDKKLSDYVNLSKVSIQEIDNIFVSNEKLFLYVGKNKLQLEIKDKAKEIKSTIIRAFFDEESTQQKLIDIKKPKIKITLNLLKNLPILDKPKIDVLLDSINLLFFALYLDIPIDKFELGKLRKKLCKEKYYNLFFR